jgi:hypothetical protein
MAYLGRRGRSDRFLPGCHEFVVSPELGHVVGMADRQDAKDVEQTFFLAEAAVLRPVRQNLVDTSVNADRSRKE